LLQALLSFFAIIDPVGCILIFQAYAQGFGLRDRVTAACVATGAAFLMLLAFSLGGDDALEYLGISQESFRVAAGLLLLPAAYRLVMEGHPGLVSASQTASPWDFALVPMATPLIAGPGALAATTAFTAQVGAANTIGAFSIVLLITLVALLAADWLFRMAGESLLRLMARIVGIVLFAIAVDFILDGVRDFARTV
jgi:multiple antibiotic resistance protein